MTEEDRQTRNSVRIKELYTPFATKIKAVIYDLEGHGFRPRIQEGYRSPEEQLAAVRRGTSTLKFGYHNITYRNGNPAACAVDIYDDDSPQTIRKEFYLKLCSAGESHGLTSGIYWGLSEYQRQIIRDAIADKDWDRPVRLGWDIYHLEIDAPNARVMQARVRYVPN